VYLNLSASVVTKDVFVSSTFRSLEATVGGAIFTNANMSVKNCHFANNSASNGAGNDVVNLDVFYFNNSDNFAGSCSVSSSPGRVATVGGVCFFSSSFLVRFFFLLIVFVHYMYYNS
jgi:hypothetical protein